MLTLRLPPEIDARLDALAQRTGRSKASYVREIIVEHLAELEALHSGGGRADRSRPTGPPTTPMEEALENFRA